MITQVPEWYNASVIVDRNLEAGREDNVAICYGDEQITYGELARRVNRFGHALKELGVGRENRVLLVLNDTPSFPVAFFAAMRIGAIPVPVNTLLGADDYRYFVEDSLARTVVVDGEHHEKVRDALDGFEKPVELILTNNGREAGVRTLEDLLEWGEDELTPADTHKDDAAFWLYSSGTTGNPKGVVHLHHDIDYTCETYARHVLEVDESDRMFSTTKLFHAYGFGNGISFPYWAGAASVLLPGRPTPEAVLQTIQQYEPTLFFCVPTLYRSILDYEEAEDYDLSSIRLCVSASEPLPADIWHRWEDTFGLTILDGIGTTEMLHIFVSNYPDEVKPGSSGKAVPGYEVRILDEEGYSLEAGDAGYLQIKGDSALAYYWRNHEETKETVKGEWLHAGDWYRLDEDGFYWYEGRADDMIKVSGLWVSPLDVENTLNEHEAVSETAAVGIPVDGLNQVKAFVVLSEGYEGSEDLAEEIQEWSEDKLKGYQQPQMIEFVEELPRNPMGKLQRKKLREAESWS